MPPPPPLFLVRSNLIVGWVVTTPSSPAQSGGTFSLERTVIAGGGGSSSGGTFALDGTIGQAVAGGPATGSPFSIYSGFWTPGIAGWGIGGEIIYGTSITKRVPRVNLALTGSSTSNFVSTLTGTYQFNSLFDGGNYTITPTKTAGQDVNGISNLDASAVARHVAGIGTPLTANQQIAGDASNNGTLSSLDASQISRFLAGFTTNIGITGQWKFIPASRSYSSLSSDFAADNYTGFLIGEVTGNWAQPTSMPDPADDSKETVKTSSDFQTVKTSSVNIPSGTTIQVSLPASASAANATVVTIPITTGNINVSDAVFAYDLRITFNPAVLTPAGPVFDTAGTITGSNGAGSGPGSDTCGVNLNTATAGVIFGGAFCNNERVGAGTLLKLRFNVVGTTGQTTALTWTATAGTQPTCPPGFCYNEFGSPPTATPVSGSFSVSGPTAADSTITGKVLTAEGMPIRRAFVTLTGADGQTRTVPTGLMGDFRFKNVESGQTYIISVSAKNRTFAVPSIVVTVKDDVGGILFTSQPIGKPEPAEKPEQQP